MIKAIFEALKEPFTALGIWLNPDKKERLILKNAIEAADNLLMILRREGKYKNMPEHKRILWEVHYQKQWDSWKDGTS